jgi:hypothetical protein
MLMATTNKQLNRTEQDLAWVQLDELAQMHEGLPWTAWKHAVLQWHLQRLATTRAEAWLPGLASYCDDDPTIMKFMQRFYQHHMQAAMRRLTDENIELRRRVGDTTECLRFYGSGGTDSGERASNILSSFNAPQTSTITQAYSRGR